MSHKTRGKYKNKPKVASVIQSQIHNWPNARKKRVSKNIDHQYFGVDSSVWFMLQLQQRRVVYLLPVPTSKIKPHKLHTRYRHRKWKQYLKQYFRLKDIFHLWQCTYGERAMLEELQKVSNRLPKNEYFHATLHLNKSNKTVFLLCQQYKSCQDWYLHIVEDKIVKCESSLYPLLIDLWAIIKDIDDIQQIMKHIKSQSPFKRKYKKLQIPVFVALSSKHLLNRDKYTKLSLLTPKKIAKLISGYLSQMKMRMNIPTDIESIIYKYHGIPEYEFPTEYLQNDNVAITLTVSQQANIELPGSMKNNEVYMLKVRVIRVRSGSLEFGIHNGDDTDAWLTIRNLESDDIIELVIDFKRKVMECYKNDTLVNGRWITSIKGQKVALIQVDHMSEGGDEDDKIEIYS